MMADFQLNRIHFCIIVLTAGFFNFSDGQCSFPPDLTGVWISAHKGSLTFTNETLSGYPTRGVLNFFVQELTFDCRVQDGSKYKLMSQELVNIWGTLSRFFICLELHYIQEYMYYYYIGTTYDLIATDHLLGNPTEAGLDEVCNRAEPYDTGSFVMLVKEGMVESGNASAQCPDDLLAKFDSVNITDFNGNNDYCEDTSLDVCTDRTMMNYTYNDTCTNVKTYSAGGIYTCMHAIADGDVTYVAVWNNDTTVDDTNTYRFTCYAVQKIGGTVYTTEAPRFCNDSDQTPFAVGEINGGNIVILSSITVTCPDYESTTTLIETTTLEVTDEVASANWTLLALLVLILLIPLIVGAALLIRKLIKKYGLPKFPKRKKPVIPKEKKHVIDLGRADQNAKRTFRLHAYQPEDTKNLVPIFKPKKPIRVSPVFDPMWEPSKLPFLLPLPKVEPLYHDTLEDYLRARLPRRPSHLSLYSFDSVIFSSDP